MLDNFIFNNRNVLSKRKRIKNTYIIENFSEAKHSKVLYKIRIIKFLWVSKNIFMCYHFFKLIKKY
jgi:hypothetical protein